jgi:two-component system chemotaxis response regulator CheB
MSDGSAGIHMLGDCGGLTVVQDPDDAAFAEMPESALLKGAVDHVAPLAAIPSLLIDLVRKPAGEKREAPEHLHYEVEMAKSGKSTIDMMDRIGRRSVVTCPECNGVMWEIEEGNAVRYRCHVGHAYSADLVNVALEESLSRALAVALRSFEERAEVARRLERQSAGRSQAASAKMWRRRILDLDADADVIRGAIVKINKLHQAKAGRSLEPVGQEP